MAHNQFQARQWHRAGAGTCLVIMLALFTACGISATVAKPTQRDFSGILQFGGTSRSYHVHLPPDYDGVRGYPLVLAFHGAGQNGLMMTALSQLNVTADRSGFVVVYPDALAGQWSVNITDGKDDIAYSIALLDDLNRTLKITPARIYAVGLATGGTFAELLACRRADRITAVGAVAATLTTIAATTCNPARPLSVILFQGDRDPLLPYTGGSSNGQIYLSAQQTAERWAQINGCTAPAGTTMLPDKVQDTTHVVYHNYTGCQQNTTVYQYTIQGGGHTWPGGEQYAPVQSIGVTSGNIDASQAIWNFFALYRK